MSLFLSVSFALLLGLFNVAYAQDFSSLEGQATSPSMNQSSVSQEDLSLENTPKRFGTTYFQRPQDGEVSLRAMTSLQNTMANSSDKDLAPNTDIITDALDLRAAVGISPSTTLEGRFSTGTDTVRFSDQEFQRKGLSDFFVKLTENKSEETYDWFYGLELGISPGRAAVPQAESVGSNRYSGGPQLSPFIGMQAESEYGFDFGGQAILNYKAARFMTDGTSHTGGHTISTEAFAEKDYTISTLGLTAGLAQRLNDGRDQMASLLPQTALSLGGYAEFAVMEQLYIPVKLNYMTGIQNKVDGVSYTSIDTFNLGAGASYYF